MRAFGPHPTTEPYATPSQVPPAWQRAVPVPRQKRVPLVHILLFAATFVTTAMAGAFQVGADPLADFGSIRAGFPFAVTLLSILLVHELGHYVLSQVHGVRATLPYFIPGPPFLVGTFGAFIRMKSPPRNRRALFDVGAAGPWAGLFVAIPAVLIGLRLSEVRPLMAHEGGLILGDSILFKALTWLAIGATPDDVTIILHPVALAGWFGLFVTFLNLLPVGQLDGGHVTYALFGRWHRWIARLFMGVIVVLALRGWQGWYLWLVLLLIIGVDHPPTQDVLTPLNWRRRLGGWLTIAVFILTFIPNPLTFADPAPIFDGETTAITSPARPAPPSAWRVLVGRAARGVAL